MSPPEVDTAKVTTVPVAKGKRLAPKTTLTMHVKVYSPFKIYFDDQAQSLSAENVTGPFDILPKHHNFMTLLNAGELIIRAPAAEQRIRIARGIMHVKADKVVIFLDV